MECKYTYKGKEYSYSELREFIKKKGLYEKDEDILYSADKQKDVYDKLRALKFETIHDLINPSIFDGEPDFNNSILDFIDSPAFINEDTGKPYITKLNDEDYFKKLKERYMLDNSATEAQADDYIAGVDANRKRIGLDAISIHRILNSLGADLDGFVESNKDVDEGRFMSSLPSLFVDMQEKFRTQVVTGAFSKCNVLKDITLKCPIKGFGLDIIGHIDNLIIDTNGDIHIVNYKITSTATKDWAFVKNEKYQYQLVFLKKMLQHYGFNTKHMTLNIIPVRVNYAKDSLGNLDYNIIRSIVPYDVHNYSIRNNKYVLNKLDDVVDKYISTPVIPEITVESLRRSENLLTAAFPTLAIKTDGIRKAAIDWLNLNTKSPLLLKVNVPEGVYRVLLFKGDIPHYIKDPTKPSENKELLEYISSRLSKLEDNIGITTSFLTKAIKGAYNTGFVNFDLLSLRNSKEYFEARFNKYLERKGDDEEENPLFVWQIVENEGLDAAGLMMFKNTETGVVDIIGFSALPLGIKKEIRGRSNIMGTYVSDTNNPELINHKYDYGNIEIFRIMAVLNLVIPELDSNIKLGNVAVYSTYSHGEGRTYNIGEYTRKYWAKMLSIIKENNKDNKDIVNNFKESQFEDPIQSLISEYESIISNSGLTTKLALLIFKVDELKQVKTIDGKRRVLHEILNDILNMGTQENYGWIGDKPLDEMMKIANSGINNYRRLVARLYLSLLNTTRLLDNLFINPDESKISTISANYLSTPETMPSANFRNIKSLYKKTIDEISDTYNALVPTLNKFIFKFYKDIGYSQLQNSVVGNLTALYANMINVEDMSLKNPFDLNNDLTKPEREFLKNFIFYIGKIRYAQRKMNWTFTGINDDNFKEAINTNAFLLYVPLKKASTASIRNSRNLWTKEFTDKTKELFSGDFGLVVDRTMNTISGVFDDLEIVLEKDLARQKLKTVNQFLLLDSAETRARVLGSHYEGYFETNLESLAKDFVERDIATKKLSGMLLETKCYLYGLKLTQFETNNDAINLTMKFIDDYLKVNVYDGTLMEATSLKIAALLLPFRTLTSHSLLGFNVIGSGRDVLQGIWENSARVLNNYQIKMSSKSLAKAYEKVVSQSFTNCMSINIVNQLCLKYRLSNIDVARITEGSKTGRGGITNFENLEYSTLRRPDFLNRMTIFVGKLIEDGVWDALSIDDGQLKYNWKKDKRFYAYANNLTSDPEYLKLRGKYFSAIREWNSENPDNAIDYSGDLPTPYSNKLVNAIKSVSDSIYGAYDRSTKSRYEYMAAGTFFGMYTTWMNGIVNNYFMRPDVYDTKNLKEAQETDINGNLLFFDKDGNIITKLGDKYINEDNNKEYLETELSPVYKYVPVVTLGIAYTLLEAAKTLRNNGWKEGFVKDIWDNDMNRLNLGKLSTDLVIFSVLSAISSLALLAVTEDEKKHKRDLALNIIESSTLAMFTKSKDTFLGPGNIMNQFETGFSYAPFKTILNIASNNYKICTGQQSILYGLSKLSAPFRTMQTAYKVYEQADKSE